MKKEEMELGKMSENNEWNVLRYSALIGSIEFKNNGFIIYYGDTKDYWNFVRYSDVRSITGVTEFSQNLLGKCNYALGDYATNDYCITTRKYYKCTAYKECAFTIYLYTKQKEIFVVRKLWTPLLKMEKLENPSIFEKIKSNFYFQKSKLHNLDHEYFKWTPYSDVELKQLFDEKEEEFQGYVKELKEMNKQFLEHLNK